MVKYVFEKESSSLDVQVLLLNKESKKVSLGMEGCFSKEELKVFNKLLSKHSNKDECLEFYTEKSKVVLFFFDYEVDKLEQHRIGAKLSKVLFKHKKAAIYVEKKEFDVSEIVFGLETANYRFNKYFTKKTEDKELKLKEVCFPCSEKSDLSRVFAISSGVDYVRDLVNEPSNTLTPEAFAKEVSKLKKAGLTIEVLDEKALKKLGFNLLLAVSQGSYTKPRVVCFSWNGNLRKKDYDLTLIGKGITFDSGGLSLKSSSNMEDMHTDMAGAAVVCGTIKAMVELKIKKNILGIIGLTENMPSGTAVKVNDIITSMSGQTVEIMNTDAEGRLVLADMITYAQKQYSSKKIIDLATLTGAVSSLFGPTYAGLFSNDEKMIADLTSAGNRSGDRVWNLPIDDYFDKAMNSEIADMRNSGSYRIGGGSQGACFLKRFVQEGTSWAHLDIAGVAREVVDKKIYPKGASGYGVRILLDYIENFV